MCSFSFFLFPVSFITMVIQSPFKLLIFFDKFRFLKSVTIQRNWVQEWCNDWANFKSATYAIYGKIFSELIRLFLNVNLWKIHNFSLRERGLCIHYNIYRWKIPSAGPLLINVSGFVTLHPLLCLQCTRFKVFISLFYFSESDRRGISGFIEDTPYGHAWMLRWDNWPSQTANSISYLISQPNLDAFALA